MREQVQIDIFTPEPAPIAPGGPPVSNAVRAILEEHDITLHTSATTQSVGPTSRTISFESGGSTSYDLLVGIPPHVPPAVVRQSKLGAHGWIEIDRDTMRTAIDAVWAIGDVSLLRLSNGMPLPKAAVFATGEAEAAARDIASSFGYDAPSPMFDGHGRCWFVTASNEAGYVDGEFLHEPAPLVALHDSTRANFALLQQDEQDWLNHWKDKGQTHSPGALSPSADSTSAEWVIEWRPPLPASTSLTAAEPRGSSMVAERSSSSMPRTRSMSP